MPANEGAASSSSQNPKPKASKVKIKASQPVSDQEWAAQSADPTDGAKSAKKKKIAGESALTKIPENSQPSGVKKKVGGQSGKSPKVSGSSPKVSGLKPKVSSGSPKVSGSLAKVSGKPAAAGGSAQSSSVLKVKKKKSSPEGKALSPKKSSMRKSSPVEEEPIEPTDDLEPVDDGDAEIADNDETTAAYAKPPKDETDADADELDAADAADDGDANDTDGDPKEGLVEDEDVTETFVLDTEAEEKGEGDSAGEKGTKEKASKRLKDSERASGRDSKLSDRRRGRASKRGEAGEAEDDAKSRDRGSKRSAAQKQSARANVKLFLFFAIGSVVGLILIPIIMWAKGIWPFEGNRIKEEAIVYSVPVYPGETFGTLITEFTEEANPESMLLQNNPRLDLTKPFDEKTHHVVIGIPRSWNWRPSGDSSFVDHFLAEAQSAVEKDPPNVPLANQNMLLLKKMMERFILKADNTEDTKKQWQKKVDEVQALITRAEGGSPPPSNAGSPANGGSTTTPTVPGTGPSAPSPERQEVIKRLTQECAPVDEGLRMAHGLLASGQKTEALAQMKSTLDLMEKLHDILPPDNLEAPVVNALNKEEGLQELHSKGDAVTLADFDAKFPEFK